MPSTFRTCRLPQALLSSALALAAAQAFAAPPDAGQILQEPRGPVPLPPAPAPTLSVADPVAGRVPEGGPRVALLAIRFSGNTAFATDALQRLVADAVGKELSFAELTGLAERVTRHYREAGYLVARAYLPAQEVKGGVLDIAVLEGTLGQVELRNAAGLEASALAPLQRLPLQSAVQEQTLQRSLLALADLPGVAVQSTLRPGTAVGASDLLVEVQKTRAFQGSVDLDNYGSVYTGQYRVGTSLYWNNPLDRGDQLSLRLQASDARLHYERIGYQLPLGEWGTRVGVAYSNMHYRLGKNFEVLDADGSARIASIYLRQPLLRSQTANWYAQLQFDDKTLRDTVGRTATTTKSDLRNVVLGLNGDWQDDVGGGARNALALNLTTGRLQLDADSLLQDAASAKSAGSFSKFNYQLQRLQALTPGLALALSLGGQQANRNLASAEKFSLGGSQGVRAYAQGEANGDEGWLATAELRWQAAPGWQVLAFHDSGSVKTNRRPWTRDSNRRHLEGAGMGVLWSTERLSFSFTAAWPMGREAAQPDMNRGPRLWGQLAAMF
ncbi:ShlB/FhaC/HecB family hemolysin secretion/activation protein [Variovorax sp. EL159]|uniref:ShlB/FhaC/HecB family hemolysin secretion/activation protein n=1 Tax=Variovorax sp. EL159 TaxID=1566270 RepID=UPI00088FAD1B|nr:ShlB/FhaC/HecB family hemolysin secretion/activation protein [Variovorax sp. EL159]SCX69001.1 Hemolysin activation/secretion protein [Variovorax sp. EL159]